jgi:hypothetical protein
MLQIILSQFAVIISLSTSAGIFLHETKIDKLASLSIVEPTVAYKKIATDGLTLLEGIPHTHSEGTSLTSASREFRTSSPSLTPRRDNDDKYRLQKKVSRGTHLFDSYHLPLDRLTV